MLPARTVSCCSCGAFWSQKQLNLMLSKLPGPPFSFAGAPFTIGVAYQTSGFGTNIFAGLLPAFGCGVLNIVVAVHTIACAGGR